MVNNKIIFLSDVRRNNELKKQIIKELQKYYRQASQLINFFQNHENNFENIIGKNNSASRQQFINDLILHYVELRKNSIVFLKKDFHFNTALQETVDNLQKENDILSAEIKIAIPPTADQI